MKIQKMIGRQSRALKKSVEGRTWHRYRFNKNKNKQNIISHAGTKNKEYNIWFIFLHKWWKKAVRYTGRNGVGITIKMNLMVWIGKRIMIIFHLKNSDKWLSTWVLFLDHSRTRIIILDWAISNFRFEGSVKMSNVSS